MGKQYIGKLLEFDFGELNDDCFTNGYLLDYSEDWTLLQYVERDISINGYVIFRNDIVKNYWVLDNRRHAFCRALRRQGRFPVSPGNIDLTDINAVFQSVNELFPLISFYRGFKDKGTFQVGGVSALTPKTITLASIDPNAEYDGFYRIRSADITKMTFSGNYERGLWAAASEKTKKRITKACTLGR